MSSYCAAKYSSLDRDQGLTPRCVKLTEFDEIDLNQRNTNVKKITKLMIKMKWDASLALGPYSISNFM